VVSDEINSPDYHDYVIKDGRLIGAFDEMYRKSKTIPWHQDDARRRLDCQLAATMVRQYAPFRRVLEIGAGLGYFAEMLTEAAGAESFLGTDISPEAVRLASQRVPRLTFEVMDVTRPEAPDGRQFDLVAMRGCMWYVFPKLDAVVRNLTDLTTTGGSLLISQNFPPLDRPFVGKDVIPNPESLVARFLPAFDIVSKVFLESQDPNSPNDHWVLFLARKR
jgi:SAM-dependent methyltransferase